MLDIAVVGEVSAFKIAVSETFAASTDVLVRLVGISVAASESDEVATGLKVLSCSTSAEVVVSVRSDEDVLV